jgi:hypothetical protein
MEQPSFVVVRENHEASKEDSMRMKLLATTILAIGLAGSAYAQSNPAPAGATIDKNQADTGGGANSNMKKPKATDSTSTGSTSMKMKKMDKTKCANPASSAGNGSLQTQGGKSNATPEDEACAAHNN